MYLYECPECGNKVKLAQPAVPGKKRFIGGHDRDPRFQRPDDELPRRFTAAQQFDDDVRSAGEHGVRRRGQPAVGVRPAFPRVAHECPVDAQPRMRLAIEKAYQRRSDVAAAEQPDPEGMA